jgi:hypothetical protein
LDIRQHRSGSFEAIQEEEAEEIIRKARKFGKSLETVLEKVFIRKNEIIG